MEARMERERAAIRADQRRLEQQLAQFVAETEKRDRGVAERLERVERRQDRAEAQLDYLASLQERVEKRLGTCEEEVARVRKRYAEVRSRLNTLECVVRADERDNVLWALVEHLKETPGFEHTVADILFVSDEGFFERDAFFASVTRRPNVAVVATTTEGRV